MKRIYLFTSFFCFMLGVEGCIINSQPTPPPVQNATEASPTQAQISASTSVTDELPEETTEATLASATATPLPPATAVVETTVPTPMSSPISPPAKASTHTFIVTNSQARHISFVDPLQGVVTQVEVGTAPWGLALAPDERLYVSTAEGVAVIDLTQRERVALVPYQADVGPAQYGEYRPGGMGLAAAPDGRQIYIGVYLPNQPSRLEILDTKTLTIVDSVPIGLRPFAVLADPDGREVFTIDHDSFSVTAIDLLTLNTRTLEVAPLDRGAFAKPHYAALDGEGKLWLPVQGQALVHLDPATGQATTIPLTANTHQHGVALTPDEKQLLIVGTGAAGGATAGPSLTIFDTQMMTEEVLPLARTHEDIAISPDGQLAYLTGGNSLTGGWEGVTIIDLASRTLTELDVAGYPLDIVTIETTPSQDATITEEIDMSEKNMALIAAAGQGDMVAVQNLLSQGASVEAQNESGVTALIAAAYQNHIEVAKILIDAGADVNIQDNTRQSAYLITTADGYLELLELTLAAGADVHSLDSFNGTGLIRAADRGHVEIIETLLQTDIKVDHINRLNWTALLEAIILGDGGPRHTEVVRLLVEAGADVNLADGSGVSPLEHARQRGHQEMVAILEEAGAR